MLGLKKIDIRPMNEPDLDMVLVIEQISFPSPWIHEHFLHEIKATHSYPFVAECNNSVVGYVCVSSLYEEAQILDIAVSPDFRGKGIALALMEKAISLAREKGAEFMVLEVKSSNLAAISLYKSLGFVRCGLRIKYYDGVDDAVIMEKVL